MRPSQAAPPQPPTSTTDALQLTTIDNKKSDDVIVDGSNVVADVVSVRRSPEANLSVVSGVPFTVKKRSGLLAGKLHHFISRSALPMGCLLGLFFLLLFLRAEIEAHTVGRILAGFCTLMCVLMTGCLVFLHLSALVDPPQQRRVIRILLMAPIYSLHSFLALWFHGLAPVLGLVRDAYESYVIYTFYHLLMGYLGGEAHALALRAGSSVRCLAPLCCLGHFSLSRRTLTIWKALLTQYMLLKPTLSFVAMILYFCDLYHEEDWSFDHLHVYFVIVLNLSVTAAFTSLVYFFVEFRSQLSEHRPAGKFLAVKAVVFVTFWQSVVLGVLVHWNVIQGSREGLWTRSEVSTGIQDFLICIEMLFVCYAHRAVFPETPYAIAGGGYRPVSAALWRYALSADDVADDTARTVEAVAGEAGRRWWSSAIVDRAASDGTVEQPTDEHELRRQE